MSESTGQNENEWPPYKGECEIFRVSPKKWPFANERFRIASTASGPSQVGAHETRPARLHGTAVQVSGTNKLLSPQSALQPPRLICPHVLNQGPT
jgi:hypothetical protein